MQDTERNRRGSSERSRVSSDVRMLADTVRTQIGPYQLIAKIGEGGMGTVWLTKLPGPAGFNKLAVVKELRADLAGSAAFVEMFLNEARLAARLTHPNVVHTYGANEDRGRLYIAMEYLDGQPWSAVRHVLWANRSLPLALHLKVLADTLSGLHHAHELRDYDGTPLQVVHRDMSPQNVFVTYDGQVKVVDFGVARAVSSQHDVESESAPMFVGKIAYSSPEQLRGDPMDRRADVFAAGVMLWEALAGRRLMEGLERAEAVRRRANEPAPRIRELLASTPRVLADICDRALCFDPADRFSTAAEFRDALVSYLNETSAETDGAQLGQLVSNAFREDRVRISGLIERSMMQRSASTSSAASASDDLPDTVRPPPPGPVEHTLRADLSELASLSTLEDENEILEASHDMMARKPPAQRGRALGAALMLIALTVGAWAWLQSARSTPSAVTTSPLPPLPPKATPSTSAPGTPTSPAPVAPTNTISPAAMASMRLEVSASPRHARIFLDDSELPNPYVGEHVADARAHVIRVSAPGARTQERVIRLDGDKRLQVTLAPLAQHAGTARSPRGADLGASDDATTTGSRTRPAARTPSDPDFDSQITPNAKARPIYEEDPY